MSLYVFFCLLMSPYVSQSPYVFFCFFISPMALHVCLWLFMSPYVSSCLLLSLLVSLCLFMSPYVSLCLLMSLHFSLSLHVSLCLFMSPYVSSCLFMSPYVSLCLLMSPYVSSCLLGKNGHLRCCPTIHDVTRCYMLSLLCFSLICKRKILSLILYSPSHLYNCPLVCWLVCFAYAKMHFLAHWGHGKIKQWWTCYKRFHPYKDSACPSISPFPQLSLLPYIALTQLTMQGRILAWLGLLFA